MKIDIPLSAGVCFYSAKYSVFVMISTNNILVTKQVAMDMFF